MAGRPLFLAVLSLRGAAPVLACSQVAVAETLACPHFPAFMRLGSFGRPKPPARSAGSAERIRGRPYTELLSAWWWQRVANGPSRLPAHLARPRPCLGFSTPGPFLWRLLCVARPPRKASLDGRFGGPTYQKPTGLPNAALRGVFGAGASWRRGLARGVPASRNSRYGLPARARRGVQRCLPAQGVGAYRRCCWDRRGPAAALASWLHSLVRY